MALKSKLIGLSYAYRKIPWMLGDCINAAQDTKLSSLVDNIGFSSAQLYDFARVADIWPEEERLGYQLAWTYFRDAGSDKAIAKPVLESALRNGYTRDQVRKIVRLVKAGIEATPQEFRPREEDG